ncbi:MAG: hypothetical protein FJ368_02025 [Pelagibacterales bacterium]|nr:hypothetical protein [Pelagibacterales bacterium]
MQKTSKLKIHTTFYYYKIFGIFFLLQFFCFFVQNSFATEIQDAIESAKANNRNIKLENIKLKSTKTLKSEAISEFLPNVKADIQYGNRNSFYQGQSYDRSTKQEVKEISLEQPLFDGMHSILKYREAKYKIKSGEALVSDKVQEISFAATQSYCNLYRYQELTKFYQLSQSLSSEILSLAKRRKNSKLIDKSDFIKFEYEASVAEEKYLDSLNRLNKAKFDYEIVIGQMHENLIAPLIKDELPNANEILENAIRQNPNLKSYRYNYLASKASYNSEKSNFLPKVSLSATASNQSNVVYLNNQDLNSRSLFFNVSVPIFQKGVEFSSLTKAKYNKDAALEEYEIAREEMEKEIAKSLEEYRFYKELNKSNERLSTLAQERVNSISEKIHSKVEDPIEFIRAKIELNDKKISHLNSQMDLAITYYKIKYFLSEL